MSTDLDEEYKNLKKLGISLSERKKISFIDDDKKTYLSDFFSIKENNISNLNISIGDESNFLREKEKSTASEGIKSINQVVIKTKDPDKIINLFKENMKIRLALDKTFKEWSGRMLFFRINGITIEVVEGDNLEDFNDYYGIGWHTDDFRRCYKSLVNNGFDLSKIRKGRKPGTLVSTLKKSYTWYPNNFDRIKRRNILIKNLLIIFVTLLCSCSEENNNTLVEDGLVEIIFATDWKAQAEQGGFYQALASGLYEERGLKVKIIQGNANVNVPRLLASNSIEFGIGSNSFIPLNMVANKIPGKAVMAVFQKDPQIIMAHSDTNITNLEDMEGLPIMISDASIGAFWLWLKSKYRFKDSQIRKKTFSLAPFLSN